MKTIQHPVIQTYRGHENVCTRNGSHHVDYTLSSGWGERINGWGLLISSNLNKKCLSLELGLDDGSEEYLHLLSDVRDLRIRDAATYLNRTMRFVGRNEGTRPHKTESVAASVLLRHVLHPDERILQSPELIIPMTVIASNHTPSLNAGKFIAYRESVARRD